MANVWDVFGHLEVHEAPRGCRLNVGLFQYSIKPFEELPWPGSADDWPGNSDDWPGSTTD